MENKTNERPIKQDLADVKLFTKRSDIARLLEPGSVGIELGVAEGFFSSSLLATGRFRMLYSVDMWAGDRGHNLAQYKKALLALWKYQSINTCIKMRFDEALDLFDDQFFDFIYIDGYAHTGQDGGKTLDDWWPKVKPNGIFAGDDYREQYPKVIEVVDAFVKRHDVDLNLLIPSKIENIWSRSPSWIVRKPSLEVSEVQAQ